MDQQGSPAFFCTTAAGQVTPVDKNTGQSADVYSRCVENPTLMMYIMHGTPYIVVCPNFFTIGLRALPPPNACLQLNRFKTQYEGNGDSVVHFQMWVLLEELAHYYIYMTTQRELDIYNVLTCVRMNGEDSSQNPHNYLYYVASKSCCNTQCFRVEITNGRQ